MTPDQMLQALSAEGDTGSDYHEGLGGWFSWSADPERRTLSITFEEHFYDGEGEKKDEHKTTATWVLSDFP